MNKLTAIIGASVKPSVRFPPKADIRTSDGLSPTTHIPFAAQSRNNALPMENFACWATPWAIDLTD